MVDGISPGRRIPYDSTEKGRRASTNAGGATSHKVQDSRKGHESEACMEKRHHSGQQYGVWARDSH